MAEFREVKVHEMTLLQFLKPLSCGILCKTKTSIKLKEAIACPSSSPDFERRNKTNLLLKR